jgi:hypothetical protein
LELLTGVALVGDHGLAAVQSAGQQGDRDLAFPARSTVSRERAVSTGMESSTSM